MEKFSEVIRMLKAGITLSAIAKEEQPLSTVIGMVTWYSSITRAQETMEMKSVCLKMLVQRSETLLTSLYCSLLLSEVFLTFAQAFSYKPFSSVSCTLIALLCYVKCPVGV